MRKQVMGESWELGTDKLIMKRGFIYCNPYASPALTGFPMQSILIFISNLGLFQEIFPSASTEAASGCSLTPGPKANPQPAELGEGIHGDSRTLAARPLRGGGYAFRISYDS